MFSYGSCIRATKVQKYGEACKEREKFFKTKLLLAPMNTENNAENIPIWL